MINRAMMRYRQTFKVATRNQTLAAANVCISCGNVLKILKSSEKNFLNEE